MLKSRNAELESEAKPHPEGAAAPASASSEEMAALKKQVALLNAQLAAKSEECESLRQTTTLLLSSLKNWRGNISGAL